MLQNADIENNLPGGVGDAGDVNINVRHGVNITGVKDGFVSSIFTRVGIGAKGNAGNININANSFSLSGGAELDSKTSSQGNAGDITINAGESISLDGSGNVLLSDENTRVAPTLINSSAVLEAVGNAGNVQLTTENLKISNGASIFSDVNRTQQGDSGDITINTGSAFLSNGGRISSNISLNENFTGESNGGNITINARDRIIIDGVSDTSRSSISSSFLEGRGKAGNIEVNTGTLSVINGGELSAFSGGDANAGDITINAKDTITFDGFGVAKLDSNEFGVAKFDINETDALLTSSVNSFHGGAQAGDGGNIRVSGKALFLTNGGNFNAANLGAGSGGNIYLDIRDQVIIDGFANNDIISNFPSGLSTLANTNGGEIQIKTGSLSVTNSGVLTSFAQQNGGDITIDARDNIIFDGADSAGNNNIGTGVFSSLNENDLTSLNNGTGKAGDINLSGKSLTVVNGAFFTSNTSGKGDAGNITVNVRENIIFDGVFNKSISSGIFSIVETNAVGNGGKIEITGKSLSVTDGAQISTSTSGKGNAGNIKINIDDTAKFDGINSNGRISGVYSLVNQGGEGRGGNIDINSGTLSLNQANISAIATSGDGGNLTFDIQDALILRRGSQVPTTAGTEQKGGNGGDITISSPVMVAVPEENSNISANAFTGNGGKVNITTQGIFGISPRPQSTILSDITASSQQGIQGEINITEPDVDPAQGIIELPTNLEDKSNQIGQVCPRTAQAARNLSKFTITGRSSLPPSPLKPLSGSSNSFNLPRPATLDDEVSQRPVKNRVNNSQKPESTTIIEAQNFVKTANGEIYLVAKVPKDILSDDPKRVVRSDNPKRFPRSDNPKRVPQSDRTSSLCTQ